MKNTNYNMVGGASTVVGVCETCSELGQSIRRGFPGRAGPRAGFGFQEDAVGGRPSGRRSTLG